MNDDLSQIRNALLAYRRSIGNASASLRRQQSVYAVAVGFGLYRLTVVHPQPDGSTAIENLSAPMPCREILDYLNRRTEDASC